VWGYILAYIVKLENIGCPCAKDWRREFIKYYVCFMLLLLILRMFDVYSPDSLPPILMTIQFVLSIVFVMIVYHYIHDLKQKKCSCSAHLARDVLEVVNYIQIFLVIIGIVLMAHVVFTISFIYNRNAAFKAAFKKFGRSKTR
jgi:hypothetical protein